MAPHGHQANHRYLRGRPLSSHPPALDLLPISSGIRNKRHGAGLASAPLSAHQSFMGNDSSYSEEAPTQQSLTCDRGTPVAVGVMVAHTGNDDTGPTLHRSRKPLQRSRWQTSNGTEVAHTGLLARRKPDGRHLKVQEACLYKIAKGNITPDKRNGFIQNYFATPLKTPSSREKMMIF